jgi:two-component system LytT family sensor kinase
LKGRTFIDHYLFWIGMYLFWVTLFRSYTFTLSRTLTVEFCYLIFITADYYLLHHFLIPRYLVKKKYALFSFALIALIAVSAWLRTLLAIQMNLSVFHATPLPAFQTVLVNSVINISLWVLVITVIKMFADRTQALRQMESLEKERIKNELDYLKAQINPHALFNSINTVYGHIDKTNPMARKILLQFSELLRYQLYDCSADKVDLTSEIEYIKNYVSFQRLRKEDSLTVSLQVEPPEAGLKIAPLLLVVPIENAFKFVSSYSDKENKICIRLCTKGTALHCQVSNTIECPQASPLEKSSGIGIANLKRRLELLYPGKFEYRIHADNDFYEINLNIDLV